MIKQILSNKRMMRLIIIGIIGLVTWWSQGGGQDLLNQIPGAQNVPSQSQSQNQNQSQNQSQSQNVGGDFSVENVAVQSESEPDLSAKPDWIPAIYLDELPPEAITVIGLIDQGGPFPYDKDGSTFQNREGILPDEQRGYYAEYTVKTPGASNRGARRIVGGDDGELYYTADHYESFSWIVLEE